MSFGEEQELVEPAQHGTAPGAVLVLSTDYASDLVLVLVLSTNFENREVLVLSTSSTVLDFLYLFFDL